MFWCCTVIKIYHLLPNTEEHSVDGLGFVAEVVGVVRDVVAVLLVDRVELLYQVPALEGDVRSELCHHHPPGHPVLVQYLGRGSSFI